MPNDSEKTTGGVDSSILSWLLDGRGEGSGPTPSHPSQVGEYEILGVIGQGGNGVVLRARHPRTKALVALKIVRPDRCTAAGLRVFDVEWRTVLELKHRSIASVIDCGWYESASGASPFYVMELITGAEGGTPLNLLDFARAKRLSIEQSVALMIQVCGAVQTAHDKGVIHRDLKPGNIPVDEADRSCDDGAQRLGVPKVVDFGLAHVLGAAIVGPGSATPSGQVAGTAMYMAPEQTRGATGETGTWTDVHALGLIAYELVTGGFPYSVHHDSDERTFEQIRTAPRIPAELVEPRVGSELSDLLAHAMAISPTSRMQTARELRLGLESWLESRRIREGVSRVARRRTTALMAPLLILASVLATMAAMWGVWWVALDSLNLNAPFERWLCRMNPPIVDQPLDDVRVVALDEAFNDQKKLDDVCLTLGIERLSMKERGGMRPLYARVARLIVEKGGALTVAIDSFFEDETSFDAPAAADLSAVNTRAETQSGPSIVVAMPWPEYDPNTGLPVGMSPVIAKSAPFLGGLTGVYGPEMLPTGQEGPETFWSVDLLVQRLGSSPIASLPAMAFAKSRGDAGLPTFSMGNHDIRAYATVGSGRNGANGRELLLPSTPIEHIEKDPVCARLGLQPGDLVDKMLVAMPSARALDAATVRMEDVAAAAGESGEGNTRLWAWFHKKVVILGDTRQVRSDHANTDIKKYPDGRAIPGVYAMAVATQWLIDGRQIHFPGRAATWALTWAMSAAGVGTIWAAQRRRRAGKGGAMWPRATIGLLAIAVVWMGSVFALYAFGLWMVSPWVPLSGLVLGAGLACVLVRFGRLESRGGRTQGVAA